MTRVLELRRGLKDVLAGGILVALGLAFALGSLAYDVGTPARSGPGFFPLVLGVVLVGLGLAILAQGFIAPEGGELGGLDWRALTLITAALLFFGFTVRGLGVGLALFVAILLSALARSRTKPVEALAIAIGLTVLSIVVFIGLLQLRLPVFGPWLPF